MNTAATVATQEEPFCLCGFVSRGISLDWKAVEGGGGWVKGFGLFKPKVEKQP
jgi:hypothetical protein